MIIISYISTALTLSMNIGTKSEDIETGLKSYSPLKKDEFDQCLDPVDHRIDADYQESSGDHALHKQHLDDLKSRLRLSLLSEDTQICTPNKG